MMGLTLCRPRSGTVGRCPGVFDAQMGSVKPLPPGMFDAALRFLPLALMPLV